MDRPPLVILAGGKGTRLGAVTQDIPKPMVEIVEGLPFLVYLVLFYYEQGFREFIISTGYRAEVIEKFPWPVHLNLNFAYDNRCLGPGIAVLTIMQRLSDAWVVNGDTFIPEALPEVDGGGWVVLTCNDIDAGAQYRTSYDTYPVIVHKTPRFYDIGTLEGLETFRSYFKTRLVKTAQLPGSD